MNPIARLEPLSLPLAQTLLHFLWQGAAIAAAAVAVERVLKNSSAQAKYLLHVTAMTAMVCSLPVTFAFVGQRAQPPGAFAAALEPVTPKPRSVRANLAPNAPERQAERDAAGDDSLTPVASVSATAAISEKAAAPASRLEVERGGSENESTSLSNEQSPRWRRWLPTAASYLIVAYLASVCALLARLAIGVWGGHRLRSAAMAVADDDLLAAVARQARRIGLRAAPAVAFSRHISVPVVVGILQPMVLLPAALASGLAPDQLEALLAHELAHLRRWDPLVNLLQRLAEAVLFFHPAVWYVSRRIDAERENACDDMVLAAGWQRVRYADSLVRMAEIAASLSVGRAPHLATLAASGGRPSDFKRRVMRLLQPQPTHFRLSNASLTVLATLVAFAVAAPLAVQSWAQQRNEDKASPVADAGGQLGRQIDDFLLPDYLGAERALNDFADREVIVIAFLGIECPVSKLYGPRLQSLAERYQSKNVAVIGIDSNQQDTPTEIGHYARKHGITFPLLKDPAGRVADQFRAERTPEAFLLDRSRTVRYWGRIDDQFGVGYARQDAKQNYVAEAIDDLLAGRTVNTPHTDAVGCHIGRIERVAPTGDITYAKQISRIIQRRCVECHREGGIAPFALESFDAVAAWAETIREVIEDRRMPPWHANPKYGHFLNDGRMPEAEKQLLCKWVANGVPRGADEDLPPRREFIEGWAMGLPDLVLTMPEPITVPATGVIDYQYVTVDPGFTEGKWVRASEIRPGVRSVVHHLVAFVNPPGGDPIIKQRGVGFEMVGGYVPGAPPMRLAEGVARYVPPGSTFVFQIHYTPDGVERHDQSQIGLYFADPATVRRTMQTGVAANLDLEIPPGDDDFRVEASHRFSHDMELHALAPHMHYRGKAFRAEAIYPNGSREVLLDVPRYDFNWQNNYKFAEPKFMPEGTVLNCVGHFDNSEDNPANPDANVAVRWGEQTWEEMMIGYFEGVFLNQDLSLPPPRITPAADGNYIAHFSYRPDRPAGRVNIAGTFNKWNNTSHAMTDADGDGVYEADVTLAPGGYRYKFVIDGDYWTHDPASRILTGFLHESFFVAGRELAERSQP